MGDAHAKVHAYVLLELNSVDRIDSKAPLLTDPSHILQALS